MRLDYLSRSAEDAGDDLHECACRSQVDGLDGAGLQVEGAIGVRVPEAVAGRSALCQMELTGRKALRSPRHIALQKRMAALGKAGMCAPHHKSQDSQLHDSCLACSCGCTDDLQAPQDCCVVATRQGHTAACGVPQQAWHGQQLRNGNVGGYRTMLMSDPKATGNTALCTELKYLQHTWDALQHCRMRREADSH